MPASRARGHVKHLHSGLAPRAALAKRKEAGDADQSQKRRDCVEEKDRGHGEVPFRDIHRMSPVPKRKFEESTQLRKNSGRNGGLHPAFSAAHGLGAGVPAEGPVN
jgi:hypothetical protein